MGISLVLTLLLLVLYQDDATQRAASRDNGNYPGVRPDYGRRARNAVISDRV